MKRNPFGIETKTAASTAIGGLVTLVLLLNMWQRWFTPPPAGTVAAIEAAMVGLAGYFARHTPRPPALQSARERAGFEEWTAAGKPLIRFAGPASSLWSYSTSPVPPDGPGTPPAAPPAATEGSTP